MATLGQFLRVPGNYEIFHDMLFTRSEGRRSRPKSIRISGISLKFGGMMHSNMKHIVIEEAMLGQFSRVPWNFEMSSIY